MLILVVDDKEVNRNLLKRMLTRIGYDVVEAADGMEAIEQVRTNDVDLILMDIMMPGMNGYEAADKIKGLSKDNYVPIIYVTALRAEEALSTALEAGGDDFISKPVNFAVLESKIKAHARIRELNQQLKETNQQLLEHNNRLAREQELITYFFDNALKNSYLDSRFIKHHVSSMSAFNGDVLLVAKRASGGLYALLGDFTGHGLTASMGTLPLAQTFFATTKNSLPISVIAREINRHLYTLLPIDMFLSAILIEIPASPDHITIWSGGMPDAYLVNSGKQSCEVIRSQHMPLGVADDNEFDMSVQMYPLSGGEKLYLCTDGIIETSNKAGEMFTEERLAKLLNQFQDAAFETVLSEYEGFKGNLEQRDDISFVEIACDNVPSEICNDSGANEPVDYTQCVPMKLDISLSAEQIRHTNPVKQIVDILAQIPALEMHRDIINTVLSELYINAVEHGVLHLESINKQDDDGFLNYYNDKAEALRQLTDGNIIINIDFTPYPHAQATKPANSKTVDKKGGVLKMRIHDSGNGFDYQQVASSFDAPFGRGLLLVSSLCEELKFEDNGTTVEALYVAK